MICLHAFNMKINDFYLSRVARDPFGLFKPASSSAAFSNEDEIILTRNIAYKIIAPIIVSAGLLGNILTIIILRNPIFQGVMFNYFFALAIFDLFSLLFSVSAIVHLLNPATPSYGAAVWFSYFEVLFINTAMGTSVLIVVCITFDRYVSVCHPHKFRDIHTHKFCKLGILLSFAIAFLVWFPTCFLKRPVKAVDCDTFFYTSQVNNSTLWVSCQVIDPSVSAWYNVYAWIREIFVSFLPIVIIIVLNGFLVKYFVEKHKHHNHTPHPTVNAPSPIVLSAARQTGDKNLKGLLKAIIIAFLITILPAGVFNAAYSENLTTSLKYELFRASANNLELLNHALNFYLYILLSKPIRTALPSMAKNVRVKLLELFPITKGSKETENKTELENRDYKTFETPEVEHRANRSDAAKRLSRNTDSRQTQISEVIYDVSDEVQGEESLHQTSAELQRSVSEIFSDKYENSENNIDINDMTKESHDISCAMSAEEKF